MTSPTGCELAPPAAAAKPNFLAVFPVTTAPKEEGEPSFEAFLDEESAAEVEEETEETDSAERVEGERGSEGLISSAALLFPLFAAVEVVPVCSPGFSRPGEPPEGGTTNERSAGETTNGGPAEAGTTSGETPTASTPVEHKLPYSVGGAEASLEHIAGKALPRVVETGGMAGAKQAAMVFTNSTFEESAAAEKKQPLGVEYVESPGFETALETEAPRPANAPVRSSEKPTEVAPVQFSQGGPTRLDRDFSVAEAIVAVEKAHDVITETVSEIRDHIQVLRTTGQDRLEVVIRPDAGTELHLQITKSEGLILVQARCDRGDFTALDSAWTHVQSSLASQGIRVEPLQAGSQPDNNPKQGEFGERNPQARDQREQGGRNQPIFFEQDTPTSPTASPGGKPNDWRARGWQRWA